MNVTLTKRTAVQLIWRIYPQLSVRQDPTPPDVAIFRASTGPEGLKIQCENDWASHNGRIKLTITEAVGGGIIIRYYHPDTLNRDFVAEQAEAEETASESRRDWVQMIGRDTAHKLVDQYWEG